MFFTPLSLPVKELPRLYPFPHAESRRNHLHRIVASNRIRGIFPPLKQSGALRGSPRKWYNGNTTSERIRLWNTDNSAARASRCLRWLLEPPPLAVGTNSFALGAAPNLRRPPGSSTFRWRRV